MKLTYFIYLQLTICQLIKYFTVIYADANKQFLTLNLIFFCREKISLSGTPISLPKIADLPIWAQENITCMMLPALWDIKSCCSIMPMPCHYRALICLTLPPLYYGRPEAVVAQTPTTSQLCQFFEDMEPYNFMSHLVKKTTKWHVHPAKTQISLGIRPVWSVFAVRMKKAWGP